MPDLSDWTDEELMAAIQKGRAEQAQKLEETRKEPMSRGTAWKYQYAHGGPFGSLLLPGIEDRYKEARGRFEGGAPLDEDYRTIADYERNKQFRKEVSEAPLWGMGGVDAAMRAA